MSHGYLDLVNAVDVCERLALPAAYQKNSNNYSLVDLRAIEDLRIV